MFDEVLKRLNLKFEDLNSTERDYLLSMVASIEGNQLTIEKLVGYIQGWKDMVENLLVDEPEFKYVFIFKVLNRQQIYLKARLKNLLLIEKLLLAPDEAKKQLNQAIANLAKAKGK